jgi:hypothetical protein
MYKSNPNVCIGETLIGHKLCVCFQQHFDRTKQFGGKKVVSFGDEKGGTEAKANGKK